MPAEKKADKRMEIPKCYPAVARVMLARERIVRAGDAVKIDGPEDVLALVESALRGCKKAQVGDKTVFSQGKRVVCVFHGATGEFAFYDDTMKPKSLLLVKGHVAEYASGVTGDVPDKARYWYCEDGKRVMALEDDRYMFRMPDPKSSEDVYKTFKEAYRERGESVCASNLADFMFHKAGKR